VAGALGDRVPTFATFNEPWCAAYLGYSAGVHAPGITDNATALRAVHHLNLAHGLGVSALRAALPSDRRVSVTLNPAYVVPASSSPEDQRAARHVDAVSNRIFLDPMLRGEYPAELFDDLRHLTDWSFVRDGDLAAIAQPIDVLGVNYYSPTRVAAATDELRAAAEGPMPNDPAAAGRPSPYPGTDLAFAMPQEGPYTAMGWRIDPPTFTELLVRLHRDYPGVPLMVTENGAAYPDAVGDDGVVHDTDRIAYLRAHIAAVHDAIERGADIRGYYAWSLMDNFEWAWGLSRRFGLVHVDYDTLVRTPKDSFHWYRDVIAANGLD
jgi:beta-glucosidase